MVKLIKDSAQACNQRRIRTVANNVTGAPAAILFASSHNPLPGGEHLEQVAANALNSLDAIGRSKSARKIVLPTVEPPPKGVIWSRLRTNLKAPKEFEEDFFVPYLGETDENLATSTKLANDLMSAPSMDSPDTSSEEEVKQRILRVIRKSVLMRGQDEKIMTQADDSDAEGELLLKKTPNLDEYIGGMWGRARKRMAIRNVAKAFPAEMWPSLVNYLCQMLVISHEAVNRYLSNAMYRENKWMLTEYENHERRMHEKIIVRQSREMPKPRNRDILNSNSVKYFSCRQCYTFDCQLHGDDTAKPLVLPYDRTRKENCPPEIRMQYELSCPGRSDGTCFFQTQPPTTNTQSRLCSLPDLAIFAKELRSHYGDDYCRITQGMYKVESESEMRGLTCRDVGLFFYLNHGGPPTKAGKEIDPKKKRSRKSKAAETYQGSSKNRPDYEACSHEGPCTKANNCICVIRGLACEKFCGCNLARVCGERVQTKSIHYCNRSFMGCDCKSAVACRTNACECFANDRECDPDLCSRCMTCTTDASGGKIRRCRNSSLRLKEHHRVVVGRSRVHGWGTYSTGNIPKGDLVGEYVGEVIVHDHAERRGRVYDKIDYTFLFNATAESTVDSTRMGNKLRFCNHSASPNCVPKLVRVCGDVRVGLYANRDIRPFEELFFDYGFGANGPAWARAGKQKGKKAAPARTQAKSSRKRSASPDAAADVESSGDSVDDLDDDYVVPKRAGKKSGAGEGGTQRRKGRNLRTRRRSNSGMDDGGGDNANGSRPSKVMRRMDGGGEAAATGKVAPEQTRSKPAQMLGTGQQNGADAPKVMGQNASSGARGAAGGHAAGVGCPVGGAGEQKIAGEPEVVDLISDSDA